MSHFRGDQSTRRIYWTLAFLHVTGLAVLEFNEWADSRMGWHKGLITVCLAGLFARAFFQFNLAELGQEMMDALVKISQNIWLPLLILGPGLAAALR
jgi:hypothetical protein